MLRLLLLPVVGDEADERDEVGGGVLLVQLLLHVGRDVRGQDLQQGLRRELIIGENCFVKFRVELHHFEIFILAK